mmetsp:Transcript_47724/g.34982  ORF Transcript_47724/g.34982 Transcript_47724/m.34982 type:complete len:88 (+) Transcript_47724:359-622(+)
MEWIERQKKTGEPIPENIEDDDSDEILAYEKDLIPHFETVREQIEKTLENREIIEQVASSQKASNEQHMHKTLYEDPFSKYKEHERE